MTPGKRKVAVVGVSLSDCGRVDDATPYALHAQAARRALADAGMDRSLVDGFASAGLGTLPPVEVAEYLGLRPTWVDSTAVGGSTWEVMAAHATDAIAAGHAEAVLLVYGSTARADIKAGRRTGNLSFGARGPLQFEVPYGHTLIAKYAMAARRHMHTYGTTLEQLASVAVQARANAALNPEAMFRTPITTDDVLSGPMIADPFTKLHCCLRSDGGAAVLLAAEEYVRDCRTAPVWILGTGEHVSHTTMSEWPDFTVSPAAVSGRLAFERAGVRPDEIDVAELYDAFTYMTLVTLEDLGFCAKGEGGQFVEKGRLTVGGELPVNTDGGGLSAQHPGMRGLFLLVEAVRQLRGEAGERQVRRTGGRLPELAVASGTGGWFCSSGTVVLGR
ncbi:MULTISPECIES: thiolase C-terminal domain-containing protein [Streptomyces]|uniref:thiolase C-terminal domain-containing protein n=1 Tax=Streptomyces TaxID=1883 RepID=UPI001165B6D1|nr:MULTISPECIES: acetyl-CoA acetyltransferase [unclassified Streptomyces]QDN78731.1 acetyl-CoA acetyltransferase [Streptomyces sp. S1A1-7]QDN99069.1 acetyl-CoA acetyltransferase [Streptomyces sp. RLB1-9]QDO20783.1 acetyl-CoA acetyltransferase [Streptomyces sp. S1A1-8]QDO30909.1 acetyl-CoA acetyltransferase [Streptomyces sp. S1A1-3]QDO40823.1 acetyl-CoA acetyltransferase [Streptomyces sp. RLB3-17]